MSCIQCRVNPATHQELNRPKNIFCGKICQWEYRLVGLRDDSLGINDPEIIGLEANDGTRIRITADQARKMKTIGVLIEDLESADEYIPLPSVTGPSLRWIQTFFQSGMEIMEPMSNQEFVDLLKAATYLDFQNLIIYLMFPWIYKRKLIGLEESRELQELASTAAYFSVEDKLDPRLAAYATKYDRETLPSECKGFSIGFLLAAQDGKLEILDALLKNNKFIDPSIYDNFAIRTASYHGHVAVVERLLQDKRVDPSEDHSGAIRYASDNGHLAVVERLLQDPRVDPSTYMNYAIGMASENGHLAVVERLLQDPRVDPSDQNNHAIAYASEKGHLAVVERLLQDPRVDPSTLNNYAIRYASENGHLAVVERLLQDPRVDPSADKDAAIGYASQKGHLAVVERLLQDPRVDPSTQNNYAIRYASGNGHAAVVERLLQDRRVDPSVVAWDLTSLELQEIYQRHQRKQRIQSHFSFFA